MTGTLSLWGLYQMDDTILDELQLPEGVDETTLKSNLLIDCAELEVLYPEPAFLKMLIGVWSLKELPTWERMNKAITTEYNPLENYDRIEEWDNTGNRSTSSTTHASSTGQGTTTDEHFVNAFNENSQVKQSTDTGASQSNNSVDSQGSGRENTSETRTGRAHGNIGVTTSQQMLEAELNVSVKTNIYNIIINSFKARFCLLVYT